MTGGSDIRAEAIERLESFANEVDRIGVEDYRRMAFGRSAAAERGPARSAALEVATAHGLADLASSAREQTGAHVLRAFGAATYRPTWIQLNWGLSLGPTDDRVAAAAVVEDAALAVVVEPFADPEVVAALRGPFDLLVAGHGDGTPTGDELPPVAMRAGGRPVSGVVATLGIVGFVVLSLILYALGLWPLAAIVVVAAFLIARRTLLPGP